MEFHSEKFENFIEPNYKFCEQVSPAANRALFDSFANEIIKRMAKEGDKVNNPYLFNSWIGELLRLLAKASDAYTKGCLAIHAVKEEVKKEE